MTGLHKRVTIGFLSIVCLLFFSGMISLLELDHLSRDTGDILEANQRNITLAKEMLDAAHEQNVALIHLSVYGDRSYDSLCRASLIRIEHTLALARKEALDKSFLDSLSFATAELRVVVDNYLAHSLQESQKESQESQKELPQESEIEEADSVAMETAILDSLTVEPVEEPILRGDRWYSEEYERHYGRLTSAITAYMTSTQSSLAPRAEQMKKNAYRAVTPVLISLVVMIAIVVMLYFFLTLYCVKPIVRMNKSLGDFMTYRVPFTVKGELKDEVQELKEKITSLISLYKQSKY